MNSRESKTPKTSFFSILGIGFAAIGLVGHSADAAIVTWDGDTDGDWSTSVNWVGNPTPPGTGDTATFDGAGNSNTTIGLASGV